MLLDSYQYKSLVIESWNNLFNKSIQEDISNIGDITTNAISPIFNKTDAINKKF